MRPERIVLIGLSGAGKSTVANLVASRLGWEAIDTDAVVVSQAGRPIAELFKEEGEDGFRRRECRALEEACAREKAVVATGGGAVLTAKGRRAIGRGFVVWLAVSPEEAAKRLSKQESEEERPLLAGNPSARLASLLEARAPLYSLADAAIDVDGLSPERAADEVVSLWLEARSRPDPAPDRLEPSSEGAPPEAAAVVRTPHHSYPVLVREGALRSLGDVCRGAGLRGSAFVLTDVLVGPACAPQAVEALKRAGYRVHVISIPAGEASKTLATASNVYDGLVAARAERTDFIVCLGGGVVTDLGGFVAGTYLRGLDFVHVPTTLLGMVDAAVGGKTGVDHPRGKNLIGGFFQPRAVVIDPAVLETLPERELRAGGAELIKHGLILDAGLVAELEAAEGDLSALRSARLIARSVAIKAAVVSEDEREQGRRTLLNYGHTIGHAIESVTGYQSWLHGEAVAVGMHAAGLIALELGLLPGEALERQQALLRSFGLPERAPGLDAGAIIDATLVDKKVRGGAVRWVLLEAIGRATLRDGVPGEVVRRAVTTVVS
jgi:shikimate kinase/3-dehydroquinate synthase